MPKDRFLCCTLLRCNRMKRGYYPFILQWRSRSLFLFCLCPSYFPPLAVTLFYAPQCCSHQYVLRSEICYSENHVLVSLYGDRRRGLPCWTEARALPPPPFASIFGSEFNNPCRGGVVRRERANENEYWVIMDPTLINNYSRIWIAYVSVVLYCTHRITVMQGECFPQKYFSKWMSVAGLRHKSNSMQHLLRIKGYSSSHPCNSIFI